MESNFYVGQEVVAIKHQSQGRFKKGNEFIIISIRQGCEHCPVLLDVGISKNHVFSKCNYCNFKRSDNNAWFDSRLFAPKQQLSETTYNDIQEWIKQGKEIAILN